MEHKIEDGKLVIECGDEVFHFPFKHEVCGGCDGYGTHLNPSIGEHAYTVEEFRDEFDEEGRREYFKREGIYDVVCHTCGGKRVIPVIDEDALDEEERNEYRAYLEYLEEDRAFRLMQESERRMGA